MNRSNRQYDVRLQFALSTSLRPMSLQRLKFRPVGSGVFEYEMCVRALAPVVAVHAAERAASSVLFGLGIREYEMVQINAKLAKGETG